MNQTPTARLPWLIRTEFFSPYENSSNSPRKQIFRDVKEYFTTL